jgi:hypothetical protein
MMTYTNIGNRLEFTAIPRYQEKLKTSADKRKKPISNADGRSHREARTGTNERELNLNDDKRSLSETGKARKTKALTKLRAVQRYLAGGFDVA